MPVLKLKNPLTFGNSTVSQLVFRDYAIAADYMAFEKTGGTSQRIALIASMTGMDEALIRKLHGRDYMAAVRMADTLLDAEDKAAAESEEITDPKS